MSRTYCIACLTCRKQLWIGQGWPHRPESRYIYSYPEATEALGDFLYAHGRTGAGPTDGREHVLMFSDDEWPEVSDLDEIELPDSQPGPSRDETTRRGHFENFLYCALICPLCGRLRDLTRPVFANGIQIAWERDCSHCCHRHEEWLHLREFAP